MVDHSSDKMSPELAAARGAQIVAAARSWIGTPYHHRASLRGIGCDCLGLVRGVWRDVIGAEPGSLPAYTGDWGDVTNDETLLAAAATHFLQVSGAAALPGDVLVFRMRADRVAKHCAIVTDMGFIHAWEAAPVIECALTEWWSRRVAGVFRFPWGAV